MFSPFIGYSPAPPAFGEVTATADATTTSGTSALLTGMTTTLPIGTYIVWFSASTRSNGTNCTQTFGLFVGGSLKGDTARTIQPYDGGTLAAANADGAVAIQGVVILTTSTVVQVQWSTAGGTATCHARNMSWLKVA